MDNLMSSVDFSDRCVCVRECVCVRNNAVVDELFIFYGISVKLSTILSTYHGHCLFIMRMLLCAHLSILVNHVFPWMRDIYAVATGNIFFALCARHTVFSPAFFFIHLSVLVSTTRCSCVVVVLAAFHSTFSYIFPLVFCGVFISVLIIALWSMFVNLHLDLLNNCQFYSINCNHFSKLYAKFFMCVCVWRGFLLSVHSIVKSLPLSFGSQ